MKESSVATRFFAVITVFIAFLLLFTGLAPRLAAAPQSENPAQAQTGATPAEPLARGAHERPFACYAEIHVVP